MRRLLIFAAAFAAAAGVYVFFMPPLLWAAAAAGAALALYVLCRLLCGRQLRAVRICLVGLCAGIVWCVGYRAVFLGSAAQYDGQQMPVEMRALDTPQASTYGSCVEVELKLDGRRLACILYLRETEPDIRPGDTLRCTAKLKLAPGSTARDEARYYRARGVWYVLSARSDLAIEHTGGGLRDLPARFAAALRTKINTVFEEDAAGFLTALLTGDRSGLSRQTREELSISGIYHTVAVSGMHVSILLGMIMLLCGSRRRLSAAVGIPTIVFFVLMTGASASAIRAGVMQTILLLAPLAKREEDPLTSLGAAGLLLVLLNPWSLYDAGLQLSFASVAGILLFAGKAYRAMTAAKWMQTLLRGGGMTARLAKGCASSFSCSLASAAFSLPVSALYFGTVSLVAPLVNALTLWAVTFLFSAGLLTALLSFVWTGLAYGPAWLVGWLARYVLQAARLFSKIPCAAVYPENAYLLVWCVFYYAVLLFCLLSPVRPKLRVVLGSLALTLGVSLGCAYAEFHTPQFVFAALDVGQGQCLLYQCGRWTAVIDCGGEDAWGAGEEAARYLQSYGEYRVEALILTHYDEDHAGGAMQLMERERVERIFLPDTQDEGGLRREIVRKANERGTQIVWVKEDQTLDFVGGQIRIFAPVSGKSSNDSGISVLASAGEYDMLVTGDMTAQTEYRLLEEKPIAQAEVLVAGHHGAATSTSYALLGRVRPQLVLISVGEDNTYGHPAEQTLERIETAGAAVYRTDERGTITIRGSKHGKTDDTKLQ